MRAVLASVVLAGLAAGSVPHLTGFGGLQQTPALKPGVFELPRRFALMRESIRGMQISVQRGRFMDAEKHVNAALSTVPGHPYPHYLMSVLKSLQGKKDEAFQSLEAAVNAGFNQAGFVQQSGELKSLQDDPRWQPLLQRMAQQKPSAAVWSRPSVPAAVQNRIALVSEANSHWFEDGNVLVSRFDNPPPKQPPEPVKGHSVVGQWLRDWYAAGTAAGHIGDFYDNHDRAHSILDTKMFPQLTLIQYSPEARAEGLDHGVQIRQLFNGVVLGNSSTANTHGVHWRSQSRLLMTSALVAQMAWHQYINSHLYVYPEHKDYDPGHNGRKPNGQPGGHGDVFPANTPYVITSQGSSGSDRPFVDAVACTLAAFHPKVKQRLIKDGVLMPTVQMIFRRCNRNVASDAAYMTGAAHPPVFQGSNVDVPAMVKMAHEMTEQDIPPLALLKVVDESPANGTTASEQLFDTPAAVARVHRSPDYQRRMVLDASASRDFNGRLLKWHWIVLQGDPKLITIKPLNPEQSRVELTIAWHPRRPIAPGAAMQTNRVDIGCFVATDARVSPPAFISTYFPDNDIREYRNGNLVSRKRTDNYADPVIAP